MITQYLEALLSSQKTEYLLGDSTGTLTRQETRRLIDSISLRVDELTATTDRQISIAIHLPRNNYYLASIFATWNTGNFYTPLNVDWPEHHLNSILGKLKPDIVISMAATLNCTAQLINPCEILEPKEVTTSIKNRWFVKNQSPGLAYIIFTSGSTGDQKGVMISKKAFCSYVDWAKRNFANLSECTKLLINGEMTFDISLADIAFSFSHDLEIHISPQPSNIFMHLKLIQDRKIDSLYAVPSTLNHMFKWANSRKDIDLTHIKQICSGGDLLTVDIIQMLKCTSPAAAIYNMYGPTELTMNCLSIRVDDILPQIISDNAVPTGIAFPHLDIRLIPIEVQMDGPSDEISGELIVAGEQLMEGYLNDSKTTAGSFMWNGHKKFYRTGDYFTRKNGIFYFNERTDHLVKVKGYRINLSDITNLISKESFVEEVRVIAIEGQMGEHQLVAFVRCVISEVDLDPMVRLGLACQRALPTYMIPSRFILIDQFPYGDTGKHNLAQLKLIAKTTG